MIPDIHKTVTVTGGSQGIGAGLVKVFLDRGGTPVELEAIFEVSTNAEERKCEHQILQTK